jgi:urea transporter
VVKAVFRGVSQVFLCDYWISGVLVVIALAICSRISAAFAVWGSAVGLATGMFFGASKASLFAGLWGYNSVLACIATGGMFFVLSWKTFVLSTACGFLCAVFQ